MYDIPVFLRSQENAYMRLIRTGAAVGSLLATFLMATPPAHAAPIGQGFTVTASDLAYILKQIKIAEAHVANTTSETGPCGGTGRTSSPARCSRWACAPSTGAVTTSSPARSTTVPPTSSSRVSAGR